MSLSEQSGNLYKRLGVKPTASPNEIKRAYRRAAQRLHPDVNVQAGATEHFLSIKEAYEILIDPESRAAYDHDLAPELGKTHPVRIDVLYSRSAIQHTQEQQLMYAYIDMEILPDLSNNNEPPPVLNVALVLDTSTSMKGDRLDVVKSTAIELLGLIRSQDYLSIITFNDRADVALKAGSHVNVRRAERSIHALRARGGTEIFKGLEAGYVEIQRNYRAGQINHLILITDGHTYGDETLCQHLADEAAQADIGLSSLGIGGKWNDSLLDNLATRTGGNCIYVHNPQEIRQSLTQKLNHLKKTYAEGLCLEYQSGLGITLNYAFRLKPEVGVLPTTSPLRLGSLPMGHHQRILFEFIIDPIPPEVKQTLLMDGELTFDIPSKSTSYQIPISLARPTQMDIPTESPSPILANALSKLTLYRMQEEAQTDISRGEFSKASTRLKNVANHLKSRGEFELAQTVIQEADRLQTKQQLSEEGKKQIKYGTRNLLLPKGYQQDVEL